jgi:DNA-binding GntR family transcriptional regulator
VTDSPIASASERPELGPLAPRTLVEQVVEAIVKGAAEGVFLPGDRVVEAEIARRLKVSRVPVREALRLLESQGIVANIPYRGMRLMDVSPDRIEKMLEVRLALEQLAMRHVLARRSRDPGVTKPLAATVDAMREAAAQSDGYGVAKADTEFHRELCRLSGNDVLLRTWEPLARQATIIFGLSALQKHMDSIVQEHVALLAALEAGDQARLERLMEVHILEYGRALDHAAFVDRLRRRTGGVMETGAGAPAGPSRRFSKRA